MASGTVAHLSRSCLGWCVVVCSLLFVAVPAHADTFGNTATGGSNQATASAVCTFVTSPATTGTITQLTAQARATASSITAQVAIYADSGSHAPTGTALATSTSVPIANAAITAYPFPISYTFAASTNYWFCLWGGTTAFTMVYDAGSTNDWREDNLGTYPTWPTWSTTFSVARKVEIYATYTPASTGCKGSLLLLGAGGCE